MQAHEFIDAVRKLQTDNGLTDDQVASALAGIVVSLCMAKCEDPVHLIRWAIDEHQKLFDRDGRTGGTSGRK